MGDIGNPSHISRHYSFAGVEHMDQILIHWPGVSRVAHNSLILYWQPLSGSVSGISLPELTLQLAVLLNCRHPSYLLCKCFRSKQLAAGVDYIDQILIHWPGVSRVAHNSPRHATERLSTWEGLSQLKSEGLIKSLGVSNFEIHHLEHLLTNAQEGPDVNQVELHPRYQQVCVRPFLDVVMAMLYFPVQ